jgi:large subunit ribosomal protein L29
MKGLHAKDLRGNDPEELLRTLAKLQGDLFSFRLKRATNQLENVMQIRTARREIARVKTVLSQGLTRVLSSNKASRKEDAASPEPQRKVNRAEPRNQEMRGKEK